MQVAAVEAVESWLMMDEVMGVTIALWMICAEGGRRLGRSSVVVVLWGSLVVVVCVERQLPAGHGLSAANDWSGRSSREPMPSVLGHFHTLPDGQHPRKRRSRNKSDQLFCRRDKRPTPLFQERPRVDFCLIFFCITFLLYNFSARTTF